MEAESELRNINQLSTSQIADLAGINTLKLPDTGSPKPHHKRSAQSGPDPHEGDHREDKSPKKKHKKHHHKRSHHRSRSKHHDEELKVPAADDNDNDNGTITGFSPRENLIKEQNPKIPLSERTKAQTQPLDHNPEKVDEPSLAHTTRGVSRPQSDDETHILEEHESVPVKQKTSNFMNSSRISDSGNGTRIEFNGQSFHETELAHFLEQRDQHVGFTFKYFLAAVLYHYFMLLYSPLFAVPFLYTVEAFTGGSMNTFYNMRFLGNDRYAWIGWLESLSLSLVILTESIVAMIETDNMTMKGWGEVGLNFYKNNLDFVLMIWARCFVLSVKYGYFSEQHWQLFRSVRLPTQILERTYISTSFADLSPAAVAKRFKDAMNRMDLREESFIIKVFADQTDSNIDDPEQIMERLRSPRKQAEFLQEMEQSMKDPKSAQAFQAKYSKQPINLSEASLRKSARMSTSQATRAVRFHKAFGKIYNPQTSTNKEAEKIERILGVQPTVEISGLSVAMEMFYKAEADLPYTQIILFALSFLYAIMPLISKAYFYEPIFQSPTQIALQTIIIIPKWTILYTCLKMIKQQNLLLLSKLKFKQMFLTLLDNRYAQEFHIQAFLPLVNMYHPMNVEALMDLLDLLGRVDESFLRRALMQSSCILLLFSIQIILIYAQVIFDMKTVKEFGAVYVQNALELFGLAMYTSMLGVFIGAETNKMDKELKRKLMAISQDFNRVKIVASQDRIFLRTPNALDSDSHPKVIIREERTGTFFDDQSEGEDSMWGDVLSSKEKKERRSRDLGRPVSKQAMAKIAVLEETVEKKLNYVSYKLEFEQLKSSFGATMSYDLITSLVVICGSITVTLLQKLMKLRKEMGEELEKKA